MSEKDEELVKKLKLQSPQWKVCVNEYYEVSNGVTINTELQCFNVRIEQDKITRIVVDFSNRPPNDMKMLIAKLKGTKQALVDQFNEEKKLLEDYLNSQFLHVEFKPN